MKFFDNNFSLKIYKFIPAFLLMFAVSSCASSNTDSRSSDDMPLDAPKPEKSEEFVRKQSDMAHEIEKYPLGIIGEVETVRLPDFKSSFEARVDTGATTCSIDAFDIKNFAGRITCPVIMGFGLQDDVCPPHTNFAAYNQIPAPKQYVTFPLSGHHVEQEAGWWQARDAFFEEYL